MTRIMWDSRDISIGPKHWVLPPGPKAGKQELSSYLLLSRSSSRPTHCFVYVLTGLECLKVRCPGLNALPRVTNTARSPG